MAAKRRHRQTDSCCASELDRVTSCEFVSVHGWCSLQAGLHVPNTRAVSGASAVNTSSPVSIPMTVLPLSARLAPTTFICLVLALHLRTFDTILRFWL